ncbi:MAG TPA: PQQ-binding-like beta-propeller repeat protein [Planctomycetaceae bacterium]|nr:PQQ-binding-like beta-propeller repeat protein [Planctomycetaceae bacterium]
MLRDLLKFSIGLGLLICISTANAADWPTHRGNPQRTGAADDQAGPTAPHVLWVHKTREHFIAAPVPGPKALYVSGLGAFNTARFDALSLDPAAQKRVLWSKTAPLLKLPTVSAPALVSNRLIFGDGMHQTDGAVLHCVTADTGLLLWQLPVPGRLVHLEGAATVVDGRVYLGGGNAGVMCVDSTRATLDGKEQPLEAIQAVLSKKWEELQAKYEQEKKVDPDFAIPPSDDSLPKPSPKLLWQQGKDQWHVDAPVAVVNNRVLVASARLDDEKIGKRMLCAVETSDGKPAWELPLKLNPWAGPTVAGNLALVGCSSIRFDPKLTSGAQGEVVAVDLATGKEKWKKPLGGGVVSAIAVRGPLAVFTATDGMLRAWNVEDGAERWSYPAGAPFFAGAALSNDVAYTADLKGVVHAVALSDGKPLWKLDLAQAPEVQAPGMVYGSPALAGGRLYVATSNLEGNAQQPTVVVCIGAK